MSCFPCCFTGELFLKAFFRFPDKRDDICRTVCGDQSLPQFGISQNATEPCKNPKVKRYIRGNQEEEQAGWHGIDRAVRNPGGVPTEYDDWLVHQTDERVAGMRQCNAISDARAMELFSLAQSVEQGLTAIGMSLKLRDHSHQFLEDGIPVFALQMKVNSGWTQKAGNPDRTRFVHGGDYRA